jgi:glycosyltransferase involved in cell wall biosynthesis
MTTRATAATAEAPPPGPVHLGLIPGNNYGWGVCSRYLIRELSARRACRVLAPGALPPGGELDGPLFMALTGVDFHPLIAGVRGRGNFAYTFFENELTATSVENARRYDCVLGGSSWCRERMIDRGIHNAGVLIQGIDPEVFYPVAEPKDPGRFVIFSGGKFELRKGQDLVLKAFRLLQDKYPDMLLLTCWYNIWPESMRLMASSPHIRFEPQALPWQDLMRRTLAANGIDAERVIVLDLVPNEEQRRLYALTDVGVFPNRCEGGTNLVLMEYMACGKPVIASFTSGHRDILSPENALLLTALKDLTVVGPDGRPIARWQEPSVEELVARIEYAYHHREAITQLGRRAGEDLKRLTWGETARRLSAVIDGAAPAERAAAFGGPA